MERLLWMEHQFNQLVWGWGSILFLLVSACWFLFRAHRLLLHPQRWFRSLFRALHGEQGKEARSSLYTALAGTLGIGSIVGAASALALSAVWQEWCSNMWRPRLPAPTSVLVPAVLSAGR